MGSTLRILCTPRCTGPCPGGCCQALLYGGADESGPLADAWILDVEEGKWVALSPSERPKSWHSADYLVTERGRYVFVFGGEGTFEEEPSEAAMASQACPCLRSCFYCCNLARPS